ncbi:uncharacterized protein LOC143617118 [Bidens hawaiensis]|uniref:uncharacterized protein LOC143617118 n=1 Tax=Bidens hawaiensis TaxID=980011 RepID=UPI00404A541A
MVHMGKACEECTQHCLTMHKKERNPASIMTTFCKVMMGDDYSKTMFLPPNFACRVKDRVGKTTQLKDFNGEEWVLEYTMIDDRVAFQGGWDTFALKHELQKGDILLFHYIMKSHFVVLMYGPTGLPETRHYGSLNLPTKENKKSNNKLTMNGQTSLKVNAICNNTSHESSSKAEPLVHEVNSVKAVNKKGKEAMMSPNEKAMNVSVPDYVRSKSPTTLMPSCLVDNNNNNNNNNNDNINNNNNNNSNLQPVAVEMVSDVGQKNNVAASGGNSEEIEINRVQKSVASDGSLKKHVAASGGGGSDESAINRIQKPILESNGGQENNVAVSSGSADETEINRIRKSMESGGGRKNNVAVSGGGADETEINRFRKSLENRIEEADKKRKESTVVHSEVTHNNSMHKRLKPASVPIIQGQPVKGEPFTGISPKSMDKWLERAKREPIMNRGSGGSIKMELATDHGSGGLIMRTPKPEPEDYDETPLSGSSNTPFSAIMSSYEYLELPSSVKWKDNKVILLRNGADRWPVLYQFKYDYKALTQNWSRFAKEKGIKPGDKCDFVLVSASTNRYACNVYDVHVTRQ